METKKPAVVKKPAPPAEPAFDYDQFHGYLKIDRNQLDVEIQRQPSLFAEVGEASAKAAASRDTAKNRLETLDAELYSKHRATLEENSSGRVTEGLVKNEVETDQAHIEAVAVLGRATYRAARIQTLKDAFHQRSYMLRDLVALYVASYFERDSVRSNADTENFKAERNRERLHEVRQAANSRSSMRKRDE